MSYSFNRVISLIPCITETLFHLGIGDKIVGRTNQCLLPKSDLLNSIPIIGSPKVPDQQLMKNIKPDLIICSQDENSINEFDNYKQLTRVWTIQPKTIKNVLELILQIGKIFDVTENSELLVKQIVEFLNQLKQSDDEKKLKAAYLLWKDPFKTINHDTYISDILRHSGFINVFSDEEDRYSEITVTGLIKHKPDIIFFPSEPFNFLPRDKGEMKKLFYGAKLFQTVFCRYCR